MSFSIPRHTSSHLKTRTPTQKIFGSPKLGEEDEKSGRLPSSGSAATRPTSGVGSDLCSTGSSTPTASKRTSSPLKRPPLASSIETRQPCYPSRISAPLTSSSPRLRAKHPTPSLLQRRLCVAACAASSLSRGATYSESESQWAASAFRAASCRPAPSVLGKPNLWRGGLQHCYLAGSPFPETATLNAAPLGISVSSRL